MKFRNTTFGGIKPTDRRWSWIEVELDAIRHNINKTKAAIGSKCKLMVVVKADAYGHGAVQIARTAMNCGAAYLGVATVDEALELRDEKISAKILVLSQPPAKAIPILIQHDIIPAVHTTEFAIHYAEAADQAGKLAPYHLAVNTGMNRIGVRYNEVLDFLRSINFHRALVLDGIFTHFATADTANQMEFKRQLSCFTQLLDNLKMAKIETGLVHAANSAAIFRYPESHFDMVRAGICIYGYYPSDLIKPYVQLDHTMSVHARIVDERILGLGEGVSYGHNYRARTSAKICTIPIGYADGLHREASGKMGVIYKGKIFPQVGSICMDMCMFEIDMNSSDAQINYNAQIGDEVLLVGRRGDAVITFEDLAEASGSLTYEMICSFSRRMPVLYT